MTTGLAPGAYAAGSTSLIAVIALLGWGAWRLRRAFLPEWSGPPARLVEVLTALAVAIGLGQILGTFGVFSPFPVAAALLGAGFAMGLIGGRPIRSTGAASVERVARSRREEVIAAALGSAVVGAQWATHVALTYGRGMTHPDTLWYHAPYAARFVESGTLTELTDRADAIQTYYPLNSSLVHGLVNLPFRNDLLSPVVNLGWAALALLAAWCIGRRRGVAPISLLAAITVLGFPMLAGTHPGQASNDVACAALLLSSVALLLETELAPVPTALAGVAAGLAIGTKLTVLAPVGALTVGIVVLAWRARRLVPAAAWCVAVAVFGSYWYARNWALADNPLPWFRLHLGPLSFPRSAVDDGDTIAQHVGDGLSWFRFQAFPGLSQALGRAWPWVLGLAAASVIAALLGRRSAMERVIALALVAGVVAYAFTPGSGRPLTLAFQARYLTPVLLISFVLLPLRVGTLAVTWRRVLCLVLLGLVALNATARHVERVPAWPSGELLIGVIAGGSVLGCAALLALWRPRVLSAPRVTLVAFIIVGAVVMAGWPLQRHYLERRYVHAHLPSDGINAYFRGVRDANVIVFGTVESYPMYGLDLSNRVSVGQGPTTPLHGDPCREWPDVLAGRYRYVVLTYQGFLVPVAPPESWFAGDPGAREVYRKDKSVVYRVNGALHPDGC